MHTETMSFSRPTDAICDDWSAPSYHVQEHLFLLLMAFLYSVSVIISAFVFCTRPKHNIPAPPPSTGHWYAVGLYDLRKPQMLPKAERNAATKYGGAYAILYERAYPSGAYAWRYTLDRVTWFYPTRSAVIRRGRTTDDDMLAHTHTA